MNTNHNLILQDLEVVAVGDLVEAVVVVAVVGLEVILLVLVMYALYIKRKICIH